MRANANFSGTFTQANNSNGNYVKFTITAGGFTIHGDAGSGSGRFPRAPVNGIQMCRNAATTPDFTISASPGTQTVNVGNATTYTASIGALNGFTGVVTLSASGLPTGATASFSPATVTGTGSSTLTVTTTGSTPVGTSTLTITGTSGSLTHSTTATLAVDSGDCGQGDQHRLLWGEGQLWGSAEVAGVVGQAELEHANGLTNTTGQGLVDESGTATGCDGPMERQRDMEFVDHGYSRERADDCAGIWTRLEGSQR